MTAFSPRSLNHLRAYHHISNWGSIVIYSAAQFIILDSDLTSPYYIRVSTLQYPKRKTSIYYIHSEF